MTCKEFLTRHYDSEYFLILNRDGSGTLHISDGDLTVEISPGEMEANRYYPERRLMIQKKIKEAKRSAALIQANRHEARNFG